jgi:nucleoside-diphosphate-sugar epimerase
VRALVTGDAGFVGRHFRERLRRAGWQVDGCDIRTGMDCRDLFRLSTTRYDLVVHCAANVGGRASIDGHPLNVALNLGIDAAMFDWAVRTRQRRVLYFSSSAAYPVRWQGRSCGRVRLTEEMVMPWRVESPDQTYGWAKVTGERLAVVARDHGVPVTVVRPFSGYGPDQDTAYPFPAFLRRAQARTDPFQVWGDGGSTRDWVHIDDVYGASMALVEDGTTEPVNIGTGRPTTFDELAALVTTAAGYAPAIEYVPDAPQGVYHRVADPTRLHRVYVPRVSLEDGIALAMNKEA